MANKNNKINPLSADDFTFLLESLATQGENFKDDKDTKRYQRLLKRTSTVEDAVILADAISSRMADNVVSHLQSMLITVLEAQQLQTLLLKDLGVTDEQIVTAVELIKVENAKAVKEHMEAIKNNQSDAEKAPKEDGMTVVSNENTVDLSLKGK